MIPVIPNRFAQFIIHTEYDLLPLDVIKTAEGRIIDILGVALAGAFNWEYKDNFLSACRRLGSGDTAVFTGGICEFPLPRAAMINATFAHVIELDDGHKNAGVHCGAAVIPLALTLGNALNSTGREILTAIVIGYDLVYRLASNMTPYQTQKGFHPSGNDNTVGCMAVAGKLLGLSEVQLENGLGLSALFASGLMEATITGQASKCIQVGNSVYNGLSAAYYAAANMEGTLTAFEGKSGFFKVKSENVDTDLICEGLGTKFLIEDTYCKLYPSARHSQPAIEAVLDLIEEYGFDWREVQEVEVGTHQLAYDMTGVIRTPRNSGEARFSLPYGVAVALHEHEFGISQLKELHTTDPENIRLAKLVNVTVDPEVQAVYPRRRGARVKVFLKDGRILRKELYELKGSPENPIGWNRLEKKFICTAGKVLGEEKTIRLLELVERMSELESVSEIMNILNST